MEQKCPRCNEAGLEEAAQSMVHCSKCGFGPVTKVQITDPAIYKYHIEREERLRKEKKVKQLQAV